MKITEGKDRSIVNNTLDVLIESCGKMDPSKAQLQLDTIVQQYSKYLPFMKNENTMQSNRVQDAIQALENNALMDGPSNRGLQLELSKII